MRPLGLLLTSQKISSPEAGGHLGVAACSVVGVQVSMMGLSFCPFPSQRQGQLEFSKHSEPPSPH